MLARFITLLAVAVFCVAGVALADRTGHAVAHVYVTVDPNISVGAITNNVDLNTVQTGSFPGEITFRVDANTEQVSLSVGTTVLYKGDDPTDPIVDPIPVAISDGAEIAPTDANPLAGGTNVAEYTGQFTNDYGFLGWATEWIAFESSQPGYFSQDVYVTVYWNQNDPEKPRGEYSGFVYLYASVGEF